MRGKALSSLIPRSLDYLFPDWAFCVRIYHVQHVALFLCILVLGVFICGLGTKVTWAGVGGFRLYMASPLGVGGSRVISYLVCIYSTR